MNSIKNPVEVGESVADRLRAVTAAWLDAKEVADRCSAKYRATVIEAIDAGMPQKKVAELAGVTTARVHAIVVREAIHG